MREKKVLVVIGAHIGDCEVMAGGIAAKAASQGWEVHLVHMTGGEKGHPKLPPEDYLRQKTEEARLFAQHIGARAHIFPYGDGELEETREVKFRLAELLRELQPRTVITHWEGSMHRDHIITSRIVVDAVFYAANRWMPVKGKPCWARLYYAENWEDPVGFTPEVYVDISDVFEKWVEGLQLCAFARGETGFNYIDYYSSLARIRGLEVGVRYAQVLMKPWYARKVRAKIENL